MYAITRVRWYSGGGRVDDFPSHNLTYYSKVINYHWNSEDE